MRDSANTAEAQRSEVLLAEEVNTLRGDPPLLNTSAMCIVADGSRVVGSLSQQELNTVEVSGSLLIRATLRVA